MQNNYFLNTGELDRQRLTILNKLYNPPAIAFLQDSGLQPGMTILEVGCGTGHMACDLAKYLGPSGKVIAIDSSENQIKIAKETASTANINNIEFHVCDVFDLSNLDIKYDATYGRWVIEFSQYPERALEIMYQHLRTNGILAYEASNKQQTAYFSHPYNSAIEQWHALGPQLFKSYDYNLQFGYEVSNVFKTLKCKNINLRASQAILKNSEEKSVYRLGLHTMKQSCLDKGIMSLNEIEILLNKLSAFEQSDGISGFYQNILISGIK